MIEILNYKFLTKEWCDENGNLYPIDFIDKLKDRLNSKYEEGAVNLTISADKIKEFYSSTSIIIEETLQKYSLINNETTHILDYNKWLVNGQRMVQSKDAFSEKSEVHHMDYDSFLATVTSDQIQDGIASTFLYNKTKGYLIKQEDFFNAVEKLNPNGDYLIVSFGINISHYIDFIKVKGLLKDNFKGLKIISYPGSRAVSQSVFIIKKVDLPSIISKEIEAEIIQKYSLDKISTNYNIYASVIDLNQTTAEIKTENSQDKSEDELKKSVLLSIIQSTEIRWEKNIELIQLIEYSEYRQKGLANSLSDIVPIATE